MFINKLSDPIGVITKNYVPTNPKDRIDYTNWQKLRKSTSTKYSIAEGYFENNWLKVYHPDNTLECDYFVPPAFIRYLERFTITDITKPEDTNNGALYIDDFRPINTTTSRKENDTMKIPTMNIDFGPVKSTEIQISPYGLAVSTPNGFRAYDVNKNQTIDVTGFTFDAKGMVYKMPVAVKDVREGDMVMHQNVPMFVTGIDDDGSIEVIDITASELKIILPTSNIFGFNFITKVVSLMNFNGIAPSADNPFGNIMPMMMMNELFNDDKNTSDSDGFMKMMMLSSMMNGSNPFANLFTPLNNN